jgi:tRNA threonylcarbamoyladenosine biosynthesis protein TsaE
MNYHINIENISDSHSFADNLASIIKAGDLITFEGELGAGKTFIIAQIIKTLLNNKEAIISSPTFNLVHNYPTSQFNIWHFDLYRLKHPEEVYELGYEDTHNGVALIEWPQIISHILPKDRLDIKIICGNEEKREIILYPRGLWIDRLKGLKYGSKFKKE